jgi:hypothetical protein
MPRTGVALLRDVADRSTRAWFLNDGEVNELQPPCMHWFFAVGLPVGGTGT